MTGFPKIYKFFNQFFQENEVLGPEFILKLQGRNYNICNFSEAGKVGNSTASTKMYWEPSNKRSLKS